MYNDPINPERLAVPEQLPRRWGTVLAALQRVASSASVQAALSAQNAQQQRNAQAAETVSRQELDFANPGGLQAAGETSQKDISAKTPAAFTENESLLADAYAKLNAINGVNND